MANIREFSGNTIGNHAAIIQGDFNATINTGKFHLGSMTFGIRDVRAQLILLAGPSDASDSFLNRISKTDPFYDKKRILELKGPFLYESFGWILNHEGFEKWRCIKNSGVLWIKGDPGKGKTMLLCGIIDDLEKNPGINANLGHFFCQATDSRINTAASVVAGLIFSLIKRHQALLSPIREKYEDKLNQLNGPNAWTVLCDIFEDVAQDSTVSDPVCIVDALDECEHDCKSLLKLIVKTSGHVKWLLSSRNIKHIERELRLIEPTQRLSLELKENAEHVSESVDAYINTSIQDIEALEDDEELQIRTTKILKDKANGTFLWVALVIEQLRDTDRRNVDDVLEEIPEGLERLYDMIIQRANEKLRQKDREACRVLLSIVTTAERPLHLEELHVFISSQWEHYKAAYNIRDIKDILKYCGSLLSVRDDTIYFIHQSVKDYMVGNAAKNIFPLGIEYQHYKMVETSLGAMSRILRYDIYDLKDPQTDISRRSRPYPDPLKPIAYCCLFWVEHLLRGGSKAEELLNDDGILHSFLKAKYLCWLETLALLGELIPQGAHALHKLKNLAIKYFRSDGRGHRVCGMANSQGEKEMNCLGSFIGDAYHFFHFWKGYVIDQPLQLYYSAIVFEDKYSAISKTFQQTIRAEFRDLPTVIKMPRRQFSLQHNIEHKGLPGYVDALVYSPNSSFLCSLSEYGIALYRTDTGTLERVIELQSYVNEERITRIPMSEVFRYIAFSADSRHLVLVSCRGTVQMWTVDSGAQTQKLSLNLDVSLLDHEVKRICREKVIGLSRNGDLAASIYRTSSDSVSLVKIWTTKTGDCILVIDQPHLPSRLRAVFSPDSALIALIHGRNARIYSARTGKDLKHIHDPSKYIKHSKFSPDSELLGLVYDGWGLYLWCTKTWTIARQIELTGPIDFEFSPDAASFVVGCKDYLALGSVETGQHLLIMNDLARRVTFSPDWTNSSLLASASFGAIQIWRAHTSDKSTEIQKPYVHDFSVTISPNSGYVAALDLEGNINIWSGNSGKCVLVLKRRNSSRARSRAVFSPDSELIACDGGNQGDVRIWHISSGKSLHLLKGLGGRSLGLRMAFSGDSKYLVTGYDKRGYARVWCVQSGKCLFQSDKYGNDQYQVQIYSSAISPGASYIAAAFQSWSKNLSEVRIWDWRTGHYVGSFNIKSGHTIESLTFSSDATALAVMLGRYDVVEGSYAYEVEIWEVATTACLARVAVGYNFCQPYFDPVTDQIHADSVSFRKRSSWEHWDKIPRQGYGISRLDRYFFGIWITFDGEKVIQIPPQFWPKDGRHHLAVTDSLLAYRNAVDDVIIARFPNQNGLKRRGIKAVLVSYDARCASWGIDASGADGDVDDGYQIKGDSGPSEPKSKKLKLSRTLDCQEDANI